jgi:hypothetical protein
MNLSSTGNCRYMYLLPFHMPTHHFIHFSYIYSKTSLQWFWKNRGGGGGQYSGLISTTLLKYRLATGWAVRGLNPGGGENFRTCPDRPCGPPSLLYNGYRVYPGGKEWPGHDADPSPPSSAVGQERVELYLYSPYGLYGLYRASVPVQGSTLPLHFPNGKAWNCVIIVQLSMATDIHFITSYQKIWTILHYIPKLILGSNFHHIPVLNKPTYLSIHDERTKLNGVQNLLACFTSLVEKCLAKTIWMVTQHSIIAPYGW